MSLFDSENNVGQFGADDTNIIRYKQAAEYAEDARLYALAAAEAIVDADNLLNRAEEVLQEARDILATVQDIKDDVTELETRVSAAEAIANEAVAKAQQAIQDTAGIIERAKSFADASEASANQAQGFSSTAQNYATAAQNASTQAQGFRDEADEFADEAEQHVVEANTAVTNATTQADRSKAEADRAAEIVANIPGKETIEGFSKLYKNKADADADVSERNVGEKVLVWEEANSTYSWYDVTGTSTNKALTLNSSEKRLKTVNNIQPDNSGNIQVTLPGGNPSLWLGETIFFQYDPDKNVSYPGLLPQDGREVNRADYPDLWQAIADNFVPSVTEAVWQSGKTNCFSTGNGTTTFRVPKWSGEVLRTPNAGDEKGEIVAQIPYVVTVNGIAPDDTTGNVQIDLTSYAKKGVNSDITSLTGLTGSLRVGADGVNALDAATVGQVVTKTSLQQATPASSGTDLINLPTGITLTQYLSNGKGVDPRMPPFNYRDSDTVATRTASVKSALEYCNTNKLSLFLSGFYKISSIEVVGHSDYTIVGNGGFIVEGSGTAALSFKNGRNITIFSGFSINAANGSSYTYGLKVYGDDSTGTSLINISGVFVGFPFAIGLGDRAYPNALCSEITINKGYSYNCRRVLEAYGAQTVCTVNGYQMIGDSQTVSTSDQGGIADAHGAVVHIANAELMSPSSSSSVALRSFAIVTGKDQSQYPDAYGSFYIVNSAIECAGILFLAFNKNNSSAPKAETGALVISACHGYMPYDSLNIQVADNFKGKIIIDETNTFHRISSKSTSFIIANGGAQPICYIADAAFDSFFPKGSSKYSGTCINLFKYKRIGKAANLNSQSITGSQNQTTLKFTQIDSSANQDSGIFSANYSPSTGIFTTPVGGLKDVCVSVQLDISAGISGSNLYVMLNGTIPVAIYSADNRIISGTVQVGNLNAGDTIRLVFQNAGATFTTGASNLDYFAMFASR